MSAHRVPGPSVVLAGEHLLAAREAVRIARLARHRNGLPAIAILTELAALLEPCPRRDSREAPQGHSEVMTSREAAEVLGVSPRTVRRLATGLGGHQIAGRLLLDAAAVNQHLAGREISE